MEYLEASRRFNITKILTDQKGKDLGEVITSLHKIIDISESIRVPARSEAGRIQAKYIASIKTLLYIINNNIEKVVADHETLAAYHDLLTDLVARNQISKNVLKQLE